MTDKTMTVTDIPTLTDEEEMSIIADARKPAWPVVAPDSTPIDCPALPGPWCEDTDTDEEK